MDRLGVANIMGFENLQKLGKEIYNYFTSFFTKDDYFFLSVNPKIFNECILRADLKEDDVISELKDSYTYIIENEFVRLSVAAFQVKTFFEVRDKEKDNLLDALAKIYNINANYIYTKFFNQSGNNNQEKLWIGEKLSVASYFKKENINLFSQINDVFNQSKESRYDTLKYVRYPETQLFFLANNIYKNELIRICQKLKFKENDSLNDIYRTLKLNSNYSCPLFLDSLKIQDDFSPDNYRRILAFSIFVYINSNSYHKDINTVFISKNITNTVHNYTFEIMKYSGKWILNIYEKGVFLDDSYDDIKAYSYLYNEISDNELIRKIFIQHIESEYESDSDIYIQLQDDSIEAELFTPCIFFSYTEIPSIQNYLFESNFLSKGIKLYKFFTVDECCSLLSATDNETASVSQIPLISQFKGGIRIGKNCWLLGCEPKIPEGCNLEAFKKEPAVYRIKKDNAYSTIEIIDSTPINDVSFSRINNCGWREFGLPSIFGFDVEPEIIKSDTNSYNTKVKKYYNPISFHNLRFSGFFDGERLIPEMAELGINGMVPIEDNYQFKDYQKELLKNKKNLSNQQLEIGQEYEFKLTYNPESNFIVSHNLVKTNNKPYKLQIIKSLNIGYRKYIKKAVVTEKKVSSNIFYLDFTINQIIANAIRLGAAYKEIDFSENVYSDEQILNKIISDYLHFAKNKDTDFFLVFRNITDIKTCQEQLDSVMKQIPENVLVFFECKENNSNSNENKEVTFSISDENYFIKQNQIKIWLKYVGFAKWSEINHKCIELLNGDSQNIQEQYGGNPIYRIFYPLISSGEVDFIKVNNDYGFTLINDVINLETSEKNQRKALDLLRQFPSVLSLIKSWGMEDYDITKYVYPKNIYGFIHDKSGNIISAKVMNYLISNKVILFKEQPNTSPHLSTFFGLFDEEEREFKIFRIPENLYEAISYCHCLIQSKKEAIFKYNLQERTLSCKKINYGIIPALLQRILILFDVKQLENDDIYMPYRNYKPFTNIPYEAIKYLKKIFGDNAVQEF